MPDNILRRIFMETCLESVPRLNSYEEFIVWYLGRNDYSMFAHEEIIALLNEVKPMFYPCIPIIKSMDADVYQYMSPCEVEKWFRSLHLSLSN